MVQLPLLQDPSRDLRYWADSHCLIVAVIMRLEQPARPPLSGAPCLTLSWKEPCPPINNEANASPFRGGLCGLLSIASISSPSMVKKQGLRPGAVRIALDTRCPVLQKQRPALPLSRKRNRGSWHIRDGAFYIPNRHSGSSFCRPARNPPSR